MHEEVAVEARKDGRLIEIEDVKGDEDRNGYADGVIAHGLFSLEKSLVESLSEASAIR
jgi:hypothetical protein